MIESRQETWGVDPFLADIWQAENSYAAERNELLETIRRLTQPRPIGGPATLTNTWDAELAEINQELELVEQGLFTDPALTN